jgi:hypothetical protein
LSSTFWFKSLLKLEFLLLVGSQIISFLMGQLNLDQATATELLDAVVQEGHLGSVALSPRSPGEQYYAFNAEDSDDDGSLSPRGAEKSPRNSARTTKSSKLERMLGEDEIMIKTADSLKPQDEKQKGKKKRGIGAFVRRLSTRAGFTSPSSSSTQSTSPPDSVSTSPTSSSSNVGSAAPLDGIQSSGSRTKLSKIFGINVEEAKSVPEINVGLVPSRSETKLSKMLGADLGTLGERRLSSESFVKIFSFVHLGSYLTITSHLELKRFRHLRRPRSCRRHTWA